MVITELFISKVSKAVNTPKYCLEVYDIWLDLISNFDCSKQADSGKISITFEPLA